MSLPKRVLGNTGISVSLVGFGMGTSGFAGMDKGLQASMSVPELAGLLRHGLDLGINFWDVSYSYGVHSHVREALKGVDRSAVVIASKTNAAGYREARQEIEDSLRVLQVDHIDIFHMHGLRSAFDFTVRRGALKALSEARKKGLIRAVGFSSHGIGATERGLKMAEMEVIMGRLNYAGAYMDSYQEGWISKAMSIPMMVKLAHMIIPRRMVPSISKLVEPPRPDQTLQQTSLELFRTARKSGKGIIGMKVFGAGTLAADPQQAISFAMQQTFVDSFVIGLTSRAEIEQNVALFSAAASGMNPEY